MALRGLNVIFLDFESNGFSISVVRLKLPFRLNRICELFIEKDLRRAEPFIDLRLFELEMRFNFFAGVRSIICAFGNFLEDFITDLCVSSCFVSSIMFEESLSMTISGCYAVETDYFRMVGKNERFLIFLPLTAFENMITR